LLARGDAELASHRTSHFDQAITAYTKALAYHPDDPHILSSLSRVYAVWSQALRDQAQPGADDTEGKRLAEQAKLYGERAAQRNPGNEEASVVLSDALRLTGNLVAARAELDRARATEGVPAAETLRVAALLAIDEANGELQAGRSLAEQAVAQDPSLIRSRLLLARCLLHVGDYEGAELHLDAVAKIDAAHPLLALARAELEAAKHGTSAQPAHGGAASANPTPAADAGTAHAALASAAQGTGAPPLTGAGAHPAAASAAPANAGATKPPAGTALSKPSASSGAQPAPAASGESAPEYAKRGEDLLERGSVPAAAHAFERALELDPGMPRAKVGLGYVALERAQPANAVGLFRAAATAGNAEALIGLGDAYRRLGKLRAALSAYREYVQRYPRGDRGSIARHQIELLTEQLSTTGSDSNP
jgi:tetratricopeptide (TPR) repeat protein